MKLQLNITFYSAILATASMAYGQKEVLTTSPELIYTKADVENASKLTTYNEKTGQVTLNTEAYSQFSVTDIRRATRYTSEVVAKSVPQDWPGCECKSPVVLAGYDFNDITGTVGSAAASTTATGITATNISGHGDITGNGGFGCFGGFATDGGAGTIGFNLTNNSATDYCISDITFDYFAEGSALGVHGPDQFIIQIGDGTEVFWQSETVNAGIGSANVSSFSMFDQQGSLLTGTSDWMEFVNGENLQIEIIAGGANGDRVGFDIDNVQVHACAVPEPSSSLLILLGASFGLVRRRR